MVQRPVRLLLTGGGTGGHLFPAIATAEAMCKRLPGSVVLFVGTKRKMDKKSLEQYGFDTKAIHSKGLKGKNIISLLQGIAILPVSILEAMIHIIRFKPDLVLGVGGYVTGPVVLAAKVLGRKTIIHEQNSIPGLANRKLGTLVTKICLSLPGSEIFFAKEKTVLTGNPVRQAILNLSREKISQNENKKTTLLVLGGSLGAHRVNELVTEACATAALKDLRVIHQTGSKDVAMVKAAYKRNNIEATVKAFFTDMAAIYKEADCLVSRAGATTLAELSVLGKPAILIPYPYAADNHQEKNAEYYVKGGGAILCIEKELTAEKLSEKLIELLNREDTMQRMAEAMRASAFPEATEKIVDECLQCLNQ
jgi:UDP-N-acetylglucosamine--N-acetylmuramyl-(pentapeptide) pyrophosphoryl-undecaprenol N-acetylglucosamine transferase